MTRIVRQDEVPALLPMAECVDAVEAALRALARGEAVLPLRQLLWLPGRTGLLGMMPAQLGPGGIAGGGAADGGAAGDGGAGVVGIKVITVMPGNHGSDLDTHQGAVLLFEAGRGRLLAVVDASSITAIRTAAASAVATRALARADAGDLAILGAGIQAASHLEAMALARPLRRVRVWSRSGEHARELARRASEGHGIEVESMASAEAAVEGADLVCTTTSAREPVLRGAWLAPGAHVNAVGACLPVTRELDTEAVRRARFYVDTRDGAFHEAGDFLIPRAEGAVGDDHVVGEIGEVLVGTAPGRTSPGEVTVFESLGIGIYDLAAAWVVWRNAEARDAGTALELGGRR
jgi:ornithine cyclodeaminase/alanine dehydrogenase-like protein (mu-crystallin family)